MIRRVRSNLRKQVGMTLIELITAMAIMGILMAIAVPNIMEFIKMSRVSSQTDALINTFAMARLKAISERKVITVCAANDPNKDDCSADSADWSNGWLVKDGSTVISRFKANAKDVNISFTKTEYTSIELAKSLGGATLSGGGAIDGDFKICGVKLKQKEQLVILSTSGRASKKISPNNCPG